MRLDYLEIEITEYCNLNCRGCCDCSNLTTERSVYKLEEYRSDLARIREIFDGIDKIRLMGGEPFLNPQIVEYACFARAFFSDCDLRIVTNGTLIPGIDTSVLTELKELGAYLDISNYPPTRRLKRQIKKRLETAGIGYNFGPPIVFFFKNYLDYPNDSGNNAFSNCIFSHCHMLGHGKLAPCSFAYCAYRLNERFDTDYPESDLVDLYSSITAAEIMQIFEQPHEFCRYCSPGMVPIRWRGGVTTKAAKIDDWVVKRDSPVTRAVSVLQAAIKRPVEFLREVAQKKR